MLHVGPCPVFELGGLALHILLELRDEHADLLSLALPLLDRLLQLLQCRERRLLCATACTLCARVLCIRVRI